MMKILLIKQTSLGDVLHMTPLLRAIKKNYPDSQIDIVTDKRALSILENNPYKNKLYVLDIYKYENNLFKSPKLFFATIKEFFSHIKNVRKENYDIAIDLQGLERSVIFLYACHAKLKFAKGKWLFVKSNYYKDINAIVGLMSFLPLFDCKSDGYELDYFLPKNIENDFNAKIKKLNINLEDKYIIISPFSRWLTKDLNVKKTREIIENIRNASDIQIIITATEDKKEYSDLIINGFDNIVNLTSLININELGFLIKNAYGMITVDSFPMHLASAFNIPLVALFGPTSELRVGPLSANSKVIRLDDLLCKMCYKRSTCPNNYKCMAELDAKLIIKTLFNIIQNKK